MITPVTTPVHGSAAPGFERVREAFAANFTRYGEQGAACAAYGACVGEVDGVRQPRAVLDALEGRLR